MQKKINELTQELDLLGTLYMAFFLEEHREAWLDFLSRTGPGKQDKRFQKHFEMTFEAMDKLFQQWLES